jgi:hypothetical protein
MTAAARVRAAFAEWQAAGWGRAEVDALRRLACEADALADETLAEIEAAEEIEAANLAEHARIERTGRSMTGGFR